MMKRNEKFKLPLRQARRQPEMMSDEDSRDSGICDMDFATMPLCFNESMGKENNLLPLAIDDMRIDDEENSFCKELMQLPNESSSVYNIRQERKMTDITMTVNNRNGHSSFRKTMTTCNVRLFDESPKSRTLFTRPSGLSLRQPNQSNRKRSFVEEDVPTKKSKFETIDEIEMDVPSTSKPSQNMILPFARKMAQTGSIPIHRAQSSSILERGQSFTRNHSNDGELPQLLEVNYHLETISAVCSNAFRRITSTTLFDLMKNQTEQEFDSKYLLVDCRYPYEFNGGHIRNAINIYDPDQCETIFYNVDGTKKDDRIPIFYCEYSQKRGPTMAYRLRRDDRQRNELRYPHCDYQEIYVLDKGFRSFFSQAQEEQITMVCEPNGYVPMNEPKFASELKKWSFHKKMANATAARNADVSRSRMMLRQMSSESHFSTIASNNSRRPLFANKSPSAFSLSCVPEVRTPSPIFQRPLRQPQFS